MVKNKARKVRVVKKYKKLPAHTYEPHPMVSAGEISKPFLIAMITVVAVVLLSLLLFFTDTFVGQAYFPGAGVNAGIPKLDAFTSGNIEIPIMANIGKAHAIGLKFTLELPVGLSCDKNFEGFQPIAYANPSDRGPITYDLDCVSNGVKFDYSTVDWEKAITGEFKVMNLNFKDVPTGSYDLKFTEFKIYDMEKLEWVIEKGEGSTVTVESGTLPPPKDSKVALESCISNSDPGWVDGTTYTLTKNVSAAGRKVCYKFDAPVTLDCQGYTITGDIFSKKPYVFEDIGVEIASDGVTIKNCNFEELAQSVVMNVPPVSSDVSFKSVQRKGITLKNNSVSSSIVGFSLVNGDSILIEDNLLDGLFAGIGTNNVNGVKISKNTVRDSLVGIVISGSVGVQVLDNEIYETSTGVALGDLSSAVLTNNKIWNGSLLLDDADNSKLNNNIVCADNNAKVTEKDGIKFTCDSATTGLTGKGNQFALVSACADGFPKKGTNYVDCSVLKTTGVTPTTTQKDAPPSRKGGGGGGCVSDYQYSLWTVCNSTLQQSRTAVDTSSCRRKPKFENRSCAPCTESWTCTQWAACDAGQQTRVCSDNRACGTNALKPAQTQACVVQKTPTQTKPSSGIPFIPDSIEEATSNLWSKYSTWIISGIAGIAIVALVVFLILHFLHKKVVYNYDELKDWVKLEQQAGTSNGDIKQILMDQTGWTEEEIHQSFAELGAPISPFSDGFQMPPEQPSA